VYDFRHPTCDSSGFHWSEIDPAWRSWTSEQFRTALTHLRAEEGFQNDYRALANCDACVLVMPCGRSAHLELGWAAGAGKWTAILLADGEPELMYGLAQEVCVSLEELLRWARSLPAGHVSGSVGALP